MKFGIYCSNLCKQNLDAVLGTKLERLRSTDSAPATSTSVVGEAKRSKND